MLLFLQRCWLPSLFLVHWLVNTLWKSVESQCNLSNIWPFECGEKDLISQLSFTVKNKPINTSAKMSILKHGIQQVLFSRRKISTLKPFGLWVRFYSFRTIPVMEFPNKILEKMFLKRSNQERTLRNRGILTWTEASQLGQGVPYVGSYILKGYRGQPPRYACFCADQTINTILV